MLWPFKSDTLDLSLAGTCHVVQDISYWNGKYDHSERDGTFSVSNNGRRLLVSKSDARVVNGTYTFSAARVTFKLDTVLSKISLHYEGGADQTAYLYFGLDLDSIQYDSSHFFVTDYDLHSHLRNYFGGYGWQNSDESYDQHISTIYTLSIFGFTLSHTFRYNTQTNLSDVVLGTTRDTSVTLYNDNIIPLQITSWHFSSDSTIQLDDTLPNVIRAQDSLRLRLHYTPRSIYASTAELSLSSDYGASALMFTGTVRKPLTYPDSLYFGPVRVGLVKDTTIILRNQSKRPIDLKSIQLNGEPMFVIVDSTIKQLSPGDSAAVTIRFTPTNAEAFAWGVCIISLDVGSSYFYLTGTPLYTTLEPKGNKPVAKSNVGQGTRFGIQLQNIGTDTATLRAIAFSDPSEFAVDSANLTRRLTPGDSALFWIRFRPIAADTIRSQVIFIGDGVTDSVQVMGIGERHTGGASSVDPSFTFDLYPTITSGVSNLVIHNQDGKSADIVLCDPLGREQLRQTLPAGSTRATLSTQTLANGLYFVKAISGNESVLRRLVVQR